MEQIGIMMHHISKTIKGYLDPSFSMVNGHYDARIPGILDPYEKRVIELRRQGYTYPQIHEIIGCEGYTGSVASLRMFMQKERAHSLTQCGEKTVTKEYVQRKSLCQLIYKKLEKIYTISEVQYNAVIKNYPILGEIYALIRDFYRIVFTQKADELDRWIMDAKKYQDISELQTFIDGTCKDVEAVKNGISECFNNGLAEESVNKIKLIKRVMYGRNIFDLLKSKVLLYEQMRC